LLFWVSFFFHQFFVILIFLPVEVETDHGRHSDQVEEKAGGFAQTSRKSDLCGLSQERYQSYQRDT
jgi:hypothetical protein